MELNTDSAQIVTTPGIVGMILLFLRWAVTRWELNESAKREAEIRISDRQTQSLDRIAGKVDEHTAKDLEHHAEVKEAVVKSMADLDKSIARMDAKLDVWSTATPVDHPSERRRSAATKAVQGT